MMEERATTRVSPTSRRQDLVRIIGVAALCVGSVLLVIASHEESKKTKWNETEVCVLLDYLLREKSKIGGAGVFPMAVYDAAAAHLNMHFTSCRPKTGRTCKTKWNALKSIYDAIQMCRSQSGIHWNGESGAKIHDEAADEVWRSHIAMEGAHALSPYRNEGWPWLRKFESILSVGGARGHNPFIATPVAAQSQSLLEDEDEEEDEEDEEEDEEDEEEDGEDENWGWLDSDAVAVIQDIRDLINGLTDLIKQGFATLQVDTRAVQLQDAVKLLQTRDDGLSNREMVVMLNLFTTKHEFVSTYLAISADVVGCKRS